MTEQERQLTHASLFSGIGGPEIAASMLGWKNVFHCEINPFGRKVLKYWFKEADSYEDITKTDFGKYRGQVNVLSGGFPCQPFSVAGKRKGANDDRYLWPEMLRVIGEVRPSWVVGENVAGISTMVEPGENFEMGYEASLFGEDNGIYRYLNRGGFTIERICSDLEQAGYSVQPVLIPACAVGAPHRRDRVFFIAHTDSDRLRDGADKQVLFAEREGKADNSDVRKNEFAADSKEHGNNRGSREILQENGGSKEFDAESVISGSVRLSSDFSSKRFSQWKQSRERQSTKEDKTATHFGFKRPVCAESIADSDCARLATALQSGGHDEKERNDEGRLIDKYPDDAWNKRTWWDFFPTVSPVCRRNDGLPFDVDNLTISFTRWRKESLKAYGNAIVPQVIYEIFRAIDIIENAHA